MAIGIRAARSWGEDYLKNMAVESMSLDLAEAMMSEVKKDMEMLEASFERAIRATSRRLSERRAEPRMCMSGKAQ
eukprot:6183237-Pleurochrysis_carterae.AAC.3